ncbi:response regulator [Devosia ginsengisoli]|uniref:response regulator n=1 Tax=Devosia ginsengisoli TaxID=400770 RepID=UPI0026F17868|nr:response regulator [Devosia ginsengisoli]MCR6669917.1 response regulator [Devosia ginsengisoli]
MTAPSGKIRVLIVDDSASVRTTLSDIISADPDLEVMATAADPYVAVERIRQEVPDVIFLDIELPRMDGLTFLRKIMSQRPIPVVICSSLAQAGSDTLMQALEARAGRRRGQATRRHRATPAGITHAHPRRRQGSRPRQDARRTEIPRPSCAPSPISRWKPN